MRKIWILGCLLLIFSCQQTRKYQLEDKLLRCFYAHHQALGIDAAKLVDSLELVYIKHHVLQSSSGESYIQLVKDIRDFGLPQKAKLVVELNKIDYFPTRIACDELLPMDTTGYASSKLVYLQELFSSIEDGGDISIEHITGEILQNFDSQDFRHDFYRSYSLLVLTVIMENKESIDVRKPPWED